MKQLMINQTTEMSLKTVDDFYQKIKNNMNLHMKMFLMIAKDIHLASRKLNEKDFLRLIKKLKLSRATTYKMKNIFESAHTEYLIERNKLPQNWTVAYQISRLSKDQFDQIKDKIEVDSPASFLTSILSNQTVSKTRQNLLKIECENTKVFNYLSGKISDLINETNNHFKIANSAILKLPTKKVNIQNA